MPKLIATPLESPSPVVGESHKVAETKKAVKTISRKMSAAATRSLREALVRGDVKGARNAIDCGADVNHKIEKTVMPGCEGVDTPFLKALRIGAFEVAELMVKHINLSAIGEKGHSALWLAIRSKQMKWVNRCYTPQMAKQSIEFNPTENVLVEAILLGFEQAVRKILPSCKSLLKNAVATQGILIRAMNRGSTGCILAILPHISLSVLKAPYVSNPGDAAHYDYNSLLQAAVFYNRPLVFDALVKKGLVPASGSQDELMMAVERKAVSMIDYLVANYASYYDHTKLNKKGENAMAIAIRSSDRSMVEALLPLFPFESWFESDLGSQDENKKKCLWDVVKQLPVEKNHLKGWLMSEKEKLIMEHLSAGTSNGASKRKNVL